jgi:hypothetical protein
MTVKVVRMCLKANDNASPMPVAIRIVRRGWPGCAESFAVRREEPGGRSVRPGFGLDRAGRTVYRRAPAAVRVSLGRSKAEVVYAP